MSISLCACIGAVDEQGRCPCQLRSLGLPVPESKCRILKDGVLQEVSPEEGMAYLSKLLTESGEAKSDKE